MEIVFKSGLLTTFLISYCYLKIENGADKEFHRLYSCSKEAVGGAL